MDICLFKIKGSIHVFVFLCRSILKIDFKIYVFIVKLRSLHEVDVLNLYNYLQTLKFKVVFQYWCIYFQSQKYTWSRLSKFMYSCSNSEVCLKQTEVDMRRKPMYLCIAQKHTGSRFFKLMYFFWNSEVYLLVDFQC